MKRFVVRYKVKKECAAENEALIRKVFEELHQKAPAGVSYSVFKGIDGVTFMHVVSVDTGVAENPITQLAAFKAFQAGIRERCEERPVSTDLESDAIGSYGFPLGAGVLPK
jgi:hypothetical protein